MSLLRALPSVKSIIFPVFKLDAFTQGLNNRDAANELENGESPDLLNVDLTTDKTITKRNGSAIVADKTGTNAVLGAASCYYGNGSAQQLKASQGFTTAGLGYRATSAATFTEASITAAGKTLANTIGTKLANADVEFENFLEKNGNQVTFLTDGTTFQFYYPTDNRIYTPNASPATTGSILRLYKNRLYMVGSSSKPERIYYSELGQGDLWTGTSSYFDVPSEAITTTGASGDPITALAVYQDRLFIFKNRSVWYWDTNVLRQVTPLHGCVGKRAFCVTDNSLFFADIDGIYRITGTLLEKATKKIQNTWDAIPATLLTKINMAFFRGKVYVATGASGATANNIILVNYVQLPRDKENQQPWSYWQGANANTLSSSVLNVYTPSNTSATILCFGCANAQNELIQLETGADDWDSSAAAAVAISSYYKTKVFPILGQFKQVFCTYKAQSATSALILTVDIDYGMNSISFNLDMQSVGGTYNNATYNNGVYGGANAVIAKNNVSIRGKFIQYTLTNNQLTQPWTFYELRQVFKPIKLR